MSSTSQTAEQTILSWVEAVNTGDIAKAKTFGAEGATWWIIGRPEKNPQLQSMVGTHPFEQNLDGIAALNQLLDAEPLKITINDIIVSAAGDRAAIEFVPYGRSSTGKVYTNTVFVKVKLNEDGKITEVREYLDLSRVEDLFSPSL